MSLWYALHVQSVTKSGLTGTVPMSTAICVLCFKFQIQKRVFGHTFHSVFHSWKVFVCPIINLKTDLPQILGNSVKGNICSMNWIISMKLVNFNKESSLLLVCFQFTARYYLRHRIDWQKMICLDAGPSLKD